MDLEQLRADIETALKDPNVESVACIIIVKDEGVHQFFGGANVHLLGAVELLKSDIIANTNNPPMPSADPVLTTRHID